PPPAAPVPPPATPPPPPPPPPGAAPQPPPPGATPQRTEFMPDRAPLGRWGAPPPAVLVPPLGSLAKSDEPPARTGLRGSR
ncbi:MAG: hypothetical protein ABW133_05720, partial [Polyangiaceae bacterium]